MLSLLAHESATEGAMVIQSSSLPPGLGERIEFFDIGPFEVSEAPCSLLVHVKEVTWQDLGVTIAGKIIQSPLPTAEQFGNPAFYWNESRETEQCFSIVIPPCVEMPHQDEDVLLFRVQCTEKQVDPPQAKFSWLPAHSLLVPQTRLQSDRLTMLELFAGGYGGWAHAAKHLGKMGFPSTSIVAVEANPEYALQYAITHNAFLCRDSTKITKAHFESIETDVILNMRIQDAAWHTFLAEVSPPLWTLSPPCQPFSKAGKEGGLNSQDGMIFAECILMARIHRPVALLIEEVEAFQAHPHYKYITEIAHYAGYRFYHAQAHDLIDVAPARRNRWLALLIAEEHSQSFPNVWEDFAKKAFASPYDFGAYIPSDDVAMHLFSLSFEEKLMYLDPLLLPSTIKSGVPKNPHAKRVPGVHAPLPTFMARYGAQHQLPREHLMQLGLFGHFFPEKMTFRYLKPAEAMLSHVHVGRQCFLTKEVSWETIGNSISMVHASVLLSNAFHMLRLAEHAPSPAACVALLVSNHWTADKIMHVHDEASMFVALDDFDVCSMKSALKMADQSRFRDSESWPEGVGFNPAKGLHDIRDLIGPPLWLIPASRLTHPECRQVVKQSAGALEMIDTPAIQPTVKDTDMISPTLHLATFVSLHVLYPNQVAAQAMVSTDCTYEAVMQVWNFRFHPEVSTSNNQLAMMHQDATAMPPIAKPIKDVSAKIDASFRLVPHERSFEACIHATKEMPVTPLMIVDNKEVHILAAKSSATVAPHLLQSFATLFDALGQPRESFFVSDFEALFVQSVKPPIDDNWKGLAKDLHQTKIEVRTPANTDNLVWIISGVRGDVPSYVALCQQVLTPDWLSMHGRQAFYQHADESKWIIVFQPTADRVAVPAETMNLHAVARLAQSVLCAFTAADASGVHVTMRYLQFRLMQGHFDPTLKLESILEALQVVFSPLFFGDTPRLVAQGTTWKHEATFADLESKKRQHDGEHKPITCFLRPGITGGGSKQEHLHTLHAGLSSLAMMYGAKVQDAPQVVQKLMQELGVPRVHHLLFVEPQEQFLSLCRECHITLPSSTPVTQHVEARMQRAKRQKQQADMRQLDISQYKLEDGYFRLPNNEPAPILQRLTNQQTGVFMTSPSELQPWTVTQKRVSADALAVFTVGTIPEPEEIRLQKHFAAQKALAPAHDNLARKVLLAGWLIQLGETHVQIPKDEIPVIPTKPAQVIAITLWADEFPSGDWCHIVAHPVKHAKKLLETEALQSAIRAPWGRTFRKKKQPCAPIEATSLQFHCEVDLQALPQLLRISGTIPLYTIAKDETVRPDPRWKIIWVAIDGKLCQPLPAPCQVSQDL